MEVKIYALVDPITMKIRYIGRTIGTINGRLSQHIHEARYLKKYTRKSNWVNSLLKINSKPLVRQLTIINSWEESYKFETELIGKYKNRLYNNYDRGIGELRNLTEKDKKKISDTLKQGYIDGRIKIPEGKTIYVYNKDGSYYKEFESISKTAKELGYYFKTVSKHINGKLAGKYPKKGYQFSTIKVEKMHDFTK